LSIVVDSSVLIAAVIDAGPQGVWAENLIATEELHAPELARAEATNVLRRLERAKLITTPEASAAYEDLAQLEVQLFPFDPFAERIWSLRHSCTSYDGWYVALAEALKLPLATLDIRLTRAKGPVCRFLKPGA
jgi:predicted nucleic acid-binding protein